MMEDIDTKLNDYQVLFKLESLNDNTRIQNNIITSLTSIGPYKNIYGNIELIPDNKYSFSFRIINSLTCKIGVIKKEKLEELKKEQNTKNVFSDFKEGFAIFSNGNSRNGSKNDLNSQKFCRGFSVGDIISVYFDGVNGSLEFFLNGKFVGCFLEETFTQDIYLPAVAIQGDNEKLMLTFFDNN